MPSTTIDKLLGSRFEVEQPAEGYRIAVDTLLLASAVPAQAGQNVFEPGCGVGGAMLALACRVPELSITGLEIQPEMAALCASNIARNGMADRLSVMAGDIAALPPALCGEFDQVMMNPPFHDHRTHSVSSLESKRLAHAETDTADLGQWLEAGARALAPDGVLTLIHRADRQVEIERHLLDLGFSGQVKPVLSHQKRGAKRIILRAFRAKNGCKPEMAVLEPFVLYGEDNRYNSMANALLRDAAAMPFD